MSNCNNKESLNSFIININYNPKLLYELMIELRTRLPPEPCIGCGVLLEEFLHNFGSINWLQISKNNNNNNNNTNNNASYTLRRPTRFYNSKNPNYQQNVRNNNNSINPNNQNNINNNNNNNNTIINETKRRKVLIKYINSLKKKFTVFTNIISAIVCSLQFFEQV